MRQRNLIIAPVVSRSNRYSFAALLGYLGPDLGADSGGPLSAVRVAPVTGLREAEALIRSAGAGTHIVFALSFCTPDILRTGPLIRKLRRRADGSRGPAVTLAAGGPHPSGDPESCVRLGIDYCFIGPGEIAFREFLLAMARGESPEGLPGIASRAVPAQGPGPDVDLDGFLPAYPEGAIFAPVEISRGCPQGCRFCQTGSLHGRRIRHRSLETLERWFRDTKARGRRNCRFISPNAFAYGTDDFRRVSHEALEGLLSLAASRLGRGNVFLGSFPSEVWPRSVTPEAVRLVKRFAGNRRLVLGAQSGSQAVLDRLHRRHTVDDVRRAARVILDEGLTPNVDFIVGFPAETDEERAESVRFMRELSAEGALIHTHRFLPLAGTPLYDAEPSPVDPATRRALEQMGGAGTAFGQWLTQERLAAETRAYLEALRGR